MIGGSTGPAERTVFYPNVSSQFCCRAQTAFHNKSIHRAAMPAPSAPIDVWRITDKYSTYRGLSELE